MSYIPNLLGSRLKIEGPTVGPIRDYLADENLEDVSAPLPVFTLTVEGLSIEAMQWWVVHIHEIYEGKYCYPNSEVPPC